MRFWLQGCFSTKMRPVVFGVFVFGFVFVSVCVVVCVCGGAEEGVDLVQLGSSSCSPAPAPRTPPGGARESADLVQQGSGIVKIVQE